MKKNHIILYLITLSIGLFVIIFFVNRTINYENLWNSDEKYQSIFSNSDYMKNYKGALFTTQDTAWYDVVRENDTDYLIIFIPGVAGFCEDYKLDKIYQDKEEIHLNFSIYHPIPDCAGFDTFKSVI